MKQENRKRILSNGREKWNLLIQKRKKPEKI